MPSRGIELGETENIHFCPAVENLRRCQHKPRWFEESWSVERIENLMRVRADLEHRWDSFDRDHRIVRSKALMHGQVCLAHSDHVRRLHTLNMIRGDARSDLRGPRFSTARVGRARANKARNARKRASRAARAVSPEQGRAALAGLVHDDAPVLMNRGMADPVVPRTPATNTSTTELMLRAHFQESHHSEIHLEHSLYMASVENAQLRQQLSRFQSDNADLHRHNLRLTAKNDQQKRELDQARNLLRDTANASARSAQDITNFLTANNA